MVNWSQALKAARLKTGFSQAKAAERLGVSLRKWVYMENGKYPPPRFIQKAYLDYLKSVAK